MSQPTKILLLENIHPGAVEALEASGFQIACEAGALTESELCERLPEFDVLGIRSKTRITRKVIEAAPNLLTIGAFCIGTNQIDLESANGRGIPVFNAPYSNTRSVAELVLAELVALSRQLGEVNSAAHRGGWLKSAKGAREVRGKVLGIVGYGHIGSQLSVLAEGLGLRVLYFDIIKKLPLGNAKAMESLESLLAASDFVTLHVPETPLTKNMIAAAQLQLMKPGSYLINASRGSVVDIPSLAAELKSGHLAGAAVDVFPKEPKNNDEKFQSELQGLPNVILTPHIGGSTEEAQAAIGLEVAESFVRYLVYGSTLGAVNFPRVDCPMTATGQRIVNVHKNVPGVLGDINGIVSRSGANIKAQYLSTDSKIGYMVMDLENGDLDAILRQIRQLSTSIRTRLL